MIRCNKPLVPGVLCSQPKQMKLIFTCLLLALFGVNLFGQTTSKKKLQAQRTQLIPKIDGLLDDVIWSGAPIACLRQVAN